MRHLGAFLMAILVGLGLTTANDSHAQTDKTCPSGQDNPQGSDHLTECW